MNAKSSIGPAWFWIAVQALVVIAESDGGYQLIRSAEQFSYLRSTRLQETLTRLKSTRVFMARMPDSYNPEKGKARD